MNKERLMRIIEDLKECSSDIYECVEVLNSSNDNLVLKLAKSSLRQLFVSFHTILEDLCSIILKEIRRFKIGITLSESLKILKEEGILDEDIYISLEKSRLIRNRISHRYKEPSHEELVSHIVKYDDEFKAIVKIANRYME
ncbi:MAG: HepT-like ribonuclease domain-containing protein [Clostridium sp.]|uniref:HepT-like ribonuclease domain-containing protein n=1 Tax=Clostridium sp. TaxID=1506 RepID=UPI0030445110